MQISQVSPQEFAAICGKSDQMQLIDVRTPVEFRELHADIAHNLPLDRLDPKRLQSEGEVSKAQPVYVVCRSGNRAAQACQKLAAAGYDKVVNVAGGMQAWEAAGLPVVRGKKAMSLERQVRIAAGALVVLGVALAWFHPAFLALSAFVGAGLVFAGITDTCGMGMLLSRMPWNQVSSSCREGQCAAKPINGNVPQQRS